MIGQTLAHYEITALLGKGGMGEVWLAKHNFLARPAAIKLVKAEALAAANILQQDFGVAADGTFFYVMDLLDGLDLEKLVERFGPLDPGRAVKVMRADGLKGFGRLSHRTTPRSTTA
mgnify:CR=1 FL=1